MKPQFQCQSKSEKMYRVMNTETHVSDLSKPLLKVFVKCNLTVSPNKYSLWKLNYKFNCGKVYQRKWQIWEITDAKTRFKESFKGWCLQLHMEKLSNILTLHKRLHVARLNGFWMLNKWEKGSLMKAFKSLDPPIKKYHLTWIKIAKISDVTKSAFF